MLRSHVAPDHHSNYVHVRMQHNDNALQTVIDLRRCTKRNGSDREVEHLLSSWNGMFYSHTIHPHPPHSLSPFTLTLYTLHPRFSNAANSLTQGPSGIISRSRELLSRACKISFVTLYLTQTLCEITRTNCAFKFKDRNGLQLRSDRTKLVVL